MQSDRGFEFFGLSICLCFFTEYNAAKMLAVGYIYYNHSDVPFECSDFILDNTVCF